ncbi:MAG: ygiC [Phycisphaerales bacterium]|nr:ygiC [Phycisphaerales bacterium]
MRRIRTTPRRDWQKTVESQGFHYHSMEEEPYWDESVYYQFTSAEIDAIEKATYALDEMCLQAVQSVIDNNLFDRFQIPPQYRAWVANSWERDEYTVYGRFDLCFDGKSEPKLLEYNADTPTSLLESAVVQWHWMQDTQPGLDQFNSIHERLIEAWQTIKATTSGVMYFTCLNGVLEDFLNTSYLRDTAMQAGFETRYIDVEAIGWNHDRGLFVDETERHIADCFKLYPWEWMLRDEFGPRLLADNTRWLEAPWKMLLSNKAILPLLYELFPTSPYLLPASHTPPAGDYVRKPILGREGANVDVVVNGQKVISTEGIYDGPSIYQQYCRLPNFDGNYPVIGSWMVNGYACGMGIREDVSPVTQNTSRFVPHVFGK